MKKTTTQGLVYSTDTGRLCPGCGQPPKQCACRRGATSVPNDGVVRISRQTKGRKGSGVTLITGLPSSEAELQQLAKDLKKKCGSGGTVRDGIIEIQGDHRQTLLEHLQRAGYRAKLAGG